MRSIPIFLFVILIILVSGCKEKTDCCVIIDTDVQIHYQNQSGENLINSSSDFDESNIKIYYKNGDEFEYIYKSNLDYPNMHRLNQDANGNLILTIFPSDYYEDNRSTTLIALNPGVVDTLVCEFELGSNSQICTQAWLNGMKMNDRYIEIEK